MRRLLFGAAMLFAASAALAADSVKVAVGHMCCGGCKAAATAGIKTVSWADDVAIDGTTCTVTAKAGEKCDVVSLRDALSKCGFPAKEIMVTGPVTVNVAHMCCGGCAADLKAKLGEVRSTVLDKDKIVVDA